MVATSCIPVINMGKYAWLGCHWLINPFSSDTSGVRVVHLLVDVSYIVLLAIWVDSVKVGPIDTQIGKVKRLWIEWNDRQILFMPHVFDPSLPLPSAVRSLIVPSKLWQCSPTYNVVQKTGSNGLDVANFGICEAASRQHKAQGGVMQKQYKRGKQTSPTMALLPARTLTGDRNSSNRHSYNQWKHKLWQTCWSCLHNAFRDQIIMPTTSATAAGQQLPWALLTQDYKMQIGW